MHNFLFWLGVGFSLVAWFNDVPGYFGLSSGVLTLTYLVKDEK